MFLRRTIRLARHNRSPSTLAQGSQSRHRSQTTEWKGEVVKVLQAIDWFVVFGASITAIRWAMGEEINRFVAVCFAIVVVIASIRNLLEGDYDG